MRSFAPGPCQGPGLQGHRKSSRTHAPCSVITADQVLPHTRAWPLLQGNGCPAVPRAIKATTTPPSAAAPKARRRHARSKSQVRDQITGHQAANSHTSPILSHFHPNRGASNAYFVAARCIVYAQCKLLPTCSLSRQPGRHMNGLGTCVEAASGGAKAGGPPRHAQRWFMLTQCIGAHMFISRNADEAERGAISPREDSRRNARACRVLFLTLHQRIALLK